MKPILTNEIWGFLKIEGFFNWHVSGKMTWEKMEELQFAEHNMERQIQRRLNLEHKIIYSNILVFSAPLMKTVIETK